MKTCEEIRRENLLILIEEAGGEFFLAEKYGCSEANIKTMARSYKDSKSGTPKEIGTKAARKLEACMNKERGWLDHDHSDGKAEAFGKLPPEVQSWLLSTSSLAYEPQEKGSNKK